MSHVEKNGTVLVHDPDGRCAPTLAPDGSLCVPVDETTYYGTTVLSFSPERVPESIVPGIYKSIDGLLDDLGVELERASLTEEQRSQLNERQQDQELRRQRGEIAARHGGWYPDPAAVRLIAVFEATEEEPQAPEAFRAGVTMTVEQLDAVIDDRDLGVPKDLNKADKIEAINLALELGEQGVAPATSPDADASGEDELPPIALEEDGG